MSVLALSVARLEGLSVVTSSGDVHHELLANREEQVFEKLLNVPLAPGSAPDGGVTVEELAHVVITTGFDLTRLTPGPDLRVAQARQGSPDLPRRSLRLHLKNPARTRTR